MYTFHDTQCTVFTVYFSLYRVYTVKCTQCTQCTVLCTLKRTDPCLTPWSACLTLYTVPVLYSKLQCSTNRVNYLNLQQMSLLSSDHTGQGNSMGGALFPTLYYPLKCYNAVLQCCSAVQCYWVKYITVQWSVQLNTESTAQCSGQ